MLFSRPSKNTPACNPITSKEKAHSRCEQATDACFPYPIRSYPGKRLFDLLLCTVALILLGPLMLLAAVAIWVTSPGPIFYRGLRAGLAGKPFWQLKFRTMAVRHSGQAITSKADPRITPVGRVLRLLRIDELPQIFNILRGEMSWVGPRPEDLDIVRRCYTLEQLRVLSARPGLTGTVQVQSFPGLEHSIPSGADPQQYYESVILPKRLEEDLRYVEQMSFWLDMHVLVQTLYCVLFKSWPILLGKKPAVADVQSHFGQAEVEHSAGNLPERPKLPVGSKERQAA
jgi:lipopolysaccharide/colanic/teichoic acid biosynthesis glycosyltransferase